MKKYKSIYDIPHPCSNESLVVSDFITTASSTGWRIFSPPPKWVLDYLVYWY